MYVKKHGLSATIDDATGKVSGTIEVTLRNDSPADGLPAHVIGNSVGEPPGTNRTYLTLYSGDKISSVQIDNADVVASAGTELGWNYAERRFSLAPGSSTTIHYQISGTVDRSQPYQLFIRSQPLPNPDQLSVQVQLASGELLAHYEGLLEQNVTLDTHNLITPTGG